jgi:outer membrane receptor protein involved in Fe transport
MRSRSLSLHLVLSLLLLSATRSDGGTTGKIAGRVTSDETGEPLIGVSVRVDGTPMGAATDLDGNYVIVNISPGTYSVTATGVGLRKKQFVQVKVNTDFTTPLDIQLSSQAIDMEAVIVQAESPMVRKDLTSSQVAIDATQIDVLPVESISQILRLQAGITQGAGGELHIRGGRSTEILYTVNGVSIANPFDNTRSVQIATNAIQELSVVSGTFNAEYGNALSGVVNTVTKEGGSSYRGSISAYTGDYASTRSDVFFNIGEFKPANHYVTEATLSGPIPLLGEQFSFFFSGRYDHDDGYLYGVREHLPSDSITRNPLDPSQIQVLTSGDGAIVSMNPSKEVSATAKLSFAPIPTMKLRYDLIYSNSDYQTYDHELKYNPDANYHRYEWGLFNSLELRHSIDERSYYTLRGSYTLNDYKRYLYPLLDASGNDAGFSAGSDIDINTLHADPRYQPDYKYTDKPAAYTFRVGGTPSGHYYQRSRTLGAKFDIISQMTKSHEIKFGAEYKNHQLDYRILSILRDASRYLVPTIPSTSTAYHDVYTKQPKEFSTYLQDKMEFESLILNVGIRYDLFAPSSRYSTNTFYPSPNSPNLPTTVDKSTLLDDAPTKHQLSPRIGVSFPITDKGIIHFSYGHFFQIPPFQYLYTNPDFKYNFATGTQVFGNADLKPEKTITYEVGLQQQLLENLAFNVSAFYKDVRDLLALQEIRISGDETYQKYVNKDYGNIKGITFSLTKRRTGGDLLGVTLDYTLQVAEGNDTNTDAFFLDLSSGRQSEKVPVPLTWDQTHTVNATITLGESNNWNVSLVGRIGTGQPYSPQIRAVTVYLAPNSGRKPTSATADLLADKTVHAFGIDMTIFMKVFNLFDTLNERYVYDDTGRATYTLLALEGPAQEVDKLAASVPGVHTADEYFVRPQYYSPPREVRVGMSVEF